MFWSGNYIVVRELNFLLKEENVTLSQVLEADDILQECKADNINLIQFLTRPDILAELITLITEEPPPGLELAAQYRLPSIACEVLTSELSTLSDKLSMDATQMTRLCEFVARPPPLNPLLASYFGKTVEMLLERSTKQDCYLYHIVCLRVLDFFKSRRDFLPNLLRHMATSAIADVFKYFIRLDDLFNKIVMEWFEEHQLLEGLIQLVCGGPPADPREKGQLDASEKQLNHRHHAANENERRADGAEGAEEAEEGAAAAGGGVAARLAAAAAANAAALLCDIVACGDARSRTQEALVARLQSEECVQLLLQSMFTSGAGARACALVQGCRVLQALLAQEPGAEAPPSAAERALAPHVPLLHQALLRGRRAALGRPRLQLAALAARLPRSELAELRTALCALGTPAVLLDMMFAFPDNNFLHGEVYTMLNNALNNRVHRTHYAKHLLLECDLLTRLMDVFEENENKKAEGEGRAPRAAYMGHVILMLERVARALDGELAALLPEPLRARWAAFCPALLQLVQQRQVPLGGYYPSEVIYEVDNMADNLEAEYEFHDMAGGTLDGVEDELAAGALSEIHKTVNQFYERASQRYDDDAWESSCAEGAAPGDEPFPAASDTWLPWEREGGAGAGAGAGWAQFDSLPAPPPPADPFAPHTAPSTEALPAAAAGGGQLPALWPAPHTDTCVPEEGSELERSVQELSLEDAGSGSLAGRLLTALSALPPHQRARLLPPPAAPAAPAPPPTESPAADIGSFPADTGSSAAGSSHCGNSDIVRLDVGSTDAASSDVGNSNVGSSSDVGSLNVGCSDVGSSDMGSSNVSSSDVGGSNVGNSNVGSSDVGSSDVGSADVGSSDVSSSDAGSSDAAGDS